ncbi:MAG: HAD family hydrolase [Bdellovibrionaceae bacterium]|nr:HAD family hydrolase [Pseudobdellovibrionaceae bacterium]
MRKAIFLDRDGTIIVDKNYLNSPDGVEFLPKAIEGLKTFYENGYLLIVVSNQAGVAKGLVDEKNIHLIHQRMDELLKKHSVFIAAYYFCPAANDSNHPERKPNPGMLLKGLEDFSLDSKNCWMVGDRLSDIEAGINANMRTVYIRNSTHALPETVTPTLQVDHLSEAAHSILSQPI